jgi:hypothetical protein
MRDASLVPAVGHCPCRGAGYRRRYDSIALAVPQVNGDRDLVQSKAPGTTEQHTFVGGTAPAVVESLVQRRAEDRAALGIREEGPIGGCGRCGQPGDHHTRSATEDGRQGGKDDWREPWSPASQQQAGSIEQKHSLQALLACDGTQPGCDSHRAQPVGEKTGAGQGVGGAPGNAQDGEAIQAEAIGQSPYVVRPVGDRAPGLEVGAAEAGPVHGENPDASLGADRHDDLRLESRARETMEVEGRRAVRIAVLGVAERPAVGQAELFRRA